MVLGAGGRPFLPGKECEKSSLRPEGFGCPGEAVSADGQGGPGDGYKRHLREPCRGEPLPDGRGEVRFESTACPNHRGVPRTELREAVDRASNILVRNVAEHAADQHDVRRYRIGIGGGERRVPLRELHSAQTFTGGAFASRLNEFRRQFNESGEHVVSPRMTRQNPEEVPSVPRAHADDPNEARWAPVESFAKAVLHDPQALGSGLAAVVASVPL